MEKLFEVQGHLCKQNQNQSNHHIERDRACFSWGRHSKVLGERLEAWHLANVMSCDCFGQCLRMQYAMGRCGFFSHLTGVMRPDTWESFVSLKSYFPSISLNRIIDEWFQLSTCFNTFNQLTRNGAEMSKGPSQDSYDFQGQTI